MEDSLLSQPDIKESLCKNLSFEEIVQLFSTSRSFQQIDIQCPITINDPIDHQSRVLPGINPTTIRAYQLIQKHGANHSLFIANDSNEIEVFRTLVQAGANIHAQDKYGHPIIDRAALKDHDQIVQILLEAGAISDSSRGNGTKALQAAALIGHLAVVQLLIDWGVLMTEPDSGPAALIYSVHNEPNSELIIQQLLDAGVDVNSVDRNGDTALTIAGNGSRISIIKLLLDRGADINHTGSLHETALLRAMRNNKREIVEFLLEQGADFNIASNQGVTLLMWATRHEHTDLVKQLVEAGADLNAVNQQGLSALTLAIQTENEELIRFFLEKGIRTDTVYNGKSLLIEAVDRGLKPELLELLLDSGVDINVVDGYGENALRKAIYLSTDNLPTIRLLIERGIDIYQRNRDNRSPLDYLLRSSNPEYVALAQSLI